MPRLVWMIMLACIGATALVGSASIMTQRAGSFSQAQIGGPFSAVDADGHAVTEGILAGKPAVLFFGYTACPDVCPTTMALLSRALHRLGDDADRLRVVFVSVDPQRDTPAVLKDYLSSFDPRIQGLTGTEAQIAELAAAFHIRREKVSGEGDAYTMAHTANALLLNASGRMVGELNYGESDASVMAKMTTLAAPPVCRPGAPGPADLWAEQATAGPGRSCGST